ncbi:MAG: hypothetical protein QNJ22_18575 [Desulfosarcinaceae bacterium]|nr:hypothetical protein [Desulfosarcinaceae bacterium]
MSVLNIQLYGEGLELYLARITRDQWLRFERRCAGWLGIYRKATLHRKWYGADSDFQRIFGRRDWRQLYTQGHRYCGPLLRRRSQLVDFWDRLVVDLDGAETRLDPRRVNTRFLAAPGQPRLGEDHVVVCHGEGYTGYTRYTLALDELFEPSKLSGEFLPCGENGFVLSTLRYGERKLSASDDPGLREVLQVRVISA